MFLGSLMSWGVFFGIVGSEVPSVSPENRVGHQVYHFPHPRSSPVLSYVLHELLFGVHPPPYWLLSELTTGIELHHRPSFALVVVERDRSRLAER